MTKQKKIEYAKGLMKSVAILTRYREIENLSHVGRKKNLSVCI